MNKLQRKEFQEDALAKLSEYLEVSRTRGTAQAFRAATGMPYTAVPFGDNVPCVCLRISTGGGKTVLGARAVPVIAEWYGGADAPVVIWLTPSDAILTQTLTALTTHGHPYREVLATRYGSRLVVCALDAVATIPAPDWGQKAIVIVSTMQSFNVEKTNIRRVYSFSETFETHFRSKHDADLRVLHGLDSAIVTEEDLNEDESRRDLLNAHLGRPKQSLANWLALQSPILIVDEAHNSKTDKSFVTLTRLNPAAVLELTATPIPGKANVVYHVSAMQLQAENMIKMPIMLAEHKDGWEKAVLAAVHTRGALADAAIKEQAAGRGYIRPMVLFQATNEGGEVPPEKLREHLQTELKIAPEQIAVATGTTRELTDADLSSPTSRICYVITVQALREGWDCPFAYVLCSLQNLSSATAVEQLLGRVLRMPYATARGEPALNRAYAHVSEKNTGHAAMALADRLIDKMGFDPLDVAALLAQAGNSPQTTFDDLNWRTEAAAREQAVATPLSAAIAAGATLPTCAEMQTNSDGEQVVVLRGFVDDAAVEQLVAAAKSKKDKESVKTEAERHNAVAIASSSPATLGVPFPKLPRLAFRDSPQGQLQLLERDVVLEDTELDLHTLAAINIGRFDLASEPDTFEISTDATDGKIVYHRADAAQIPLNYGATHLTASDVARWLDQMLFQKAAYLTQAQRVGYFVAVIEHQMNTHRYEIGRLAEARYVLARRIENKLIDLRNEACRGLFKQAVLDEGWLLEADWRDPFEFKPNSYAASPATRCGGRMRFAKNQYGATIADMKSEGEEFDCLVAIDGHPRVERWIRNLDTPPGFSLPTSRGKFFPDFLLMLIDGTVVVIEYKGQHLRSDSYEIEKRAVGRLWAGKTKGVCRFDFVFKRGDSGESLAEQLAVLLT